jgi:dTDP-4-dehydrorhamnose 3,5-epimerase
MIFKERKLKGVFEINPNVSYDNRGFFMRTYDKEIFKRNFIDQDWIQENHSGTISKGTIRGMHIQLPPFSEAKLVRCIKGKILNAFIDLRINSETFGKWDMIELSSINKKMIFIPRGFANGFCIVENDSELIYKTDNMYKPEFERRIKWNDPDIGIKWPISNPILSEKDMNNDSFLHIKKELKESNLF